MNPLLINDRLIDGFLMMAGWVLLLQAVPEPPLPNQAVSGAPLPNQAAGPPLPNQAVPGPPLHSQAGRGKPARGSQPADGAKRKGKGRPLKMQAAAACSVLPFLHTLELCFTGTLPTCTPKLVMMSLLWFPNIAGIVASLSRLELCFKGSAPCLIL